MAAAGMRMFCRGELCCAGECVEATDTFDDASTTGWTTTGTVTEASGLMDLVQGSTAIFDTASGSVSHDVAIRTDPLNTDDAAELRLRVCYTDANNFLFGQFLKFDDGGTIKATLRLGRVLGGSETWLTDTVEVDDTDAELDARGDLCLSFEPGDVQTGEELVTDDYASDSDGTGDWTDTGEMLGPEDGTGGIGECGFGEITRQFHFHGLAVPPGSTGFGISVRITCRCQPLSGITAIDLTSLRVSGAVTGTAGDDKAGAQSINTTTYTELGGGSTTDDWNAGFTWEDFSPGFTIITAWDSSGVRNLDIDAVNVELTFTTPDRQPGVLRLSHTNTGSPNNVQCATELSAENPADGLKTGLHAVTGDWDVDSYTLNCTPCPCDAGSGGDAEPCECCDQDFPPAASYVIDLGAGGWTDNLCEFCDTVAGEYELTALSACSWGYQEDIECPADGGGQCYPRLMLMRLYLVRVGADCFWRFVITLPGNCADEYTAFVSYSSAALSSEEDCQSMPVTLSVVSQVNTLCGGNLPGTIALEAA